MTNNEWRHERIENWIQMETMMAKKAIEAIEIGDYELALVYLKDAKTARKRITYLRK